MAFTSINYIIVCFLASPATIQLLEGYGWSSIPRIPQSVQQQQQKSGASFVEGPTYNAVSGTQLQF